MDRPVKVRENYPAPNGTGFPPPYTTAHGDIFAGLSYFTAA